MSEALTYSNQYSSHHHGHAWYLPTGAGQRELANSEAFRIDKADCTAPCSTNFLLERTHQPVQVCTGFQGSNAF